MIPERLRECLKILRWSRADLAEQLGCPESEVTISLDGRVVAPIAVAAWLETVVNAHRALPAPSLGNPESTRVNGAIKLTDVDVVKRRISRPELDGISVQCANARRASNATGRRDKGREFRTMQHVRFKEPVTVLVGMGLPVRIQIVMEVYALLQDWPAANRDSTHAVALDACRAGIAGEIDAETVRSTFVAFARRNDILVPDMDALMPAVTTASSSSANA